MKNIFAYLLFISSIIFLSTACGGDDDGGGINPTNVNSQADCQEQYDNDIEEDYINALTNYVTEPENMELCREFIDAGQAFAVEFKDFVECLEDNGFDVEDYAATQQSLDEFEESFNDLDCN